MGVVNFALHRAVVESGHPLVTGSKLYLGRYGSYILEFAMLTGALIFASTGSLPIILVYIFYTVLNGFAAYLLLSGRI